MWENKAQRKAIMPKFNDTQDTHFLQQAANLTNGLYWRIPYQSDVFPYLV